MDDAVMKQALIDMLKDEPLPILRLAYINAKMYAKYGEDVTRAWDTAIQKCKAMDIAYHKGYHDALERSER